MKTNCKTNQKIRTIKLLLGIVAGAAIYLTLELFF